MSEDQKPDYAALNKQWAKELMENSAAQEYCNPYSAFSFKYFCEAYARTKSYGLQWGEFGNVFGVAFFAFDLEAEFSAGADDGVDAVGGRVLP